MALCFWFTTKTILIAHRCTLFTVVEVCFHSIKVLSVSHSIICKESLEKNVLQKLSLLLRHLLWSMILSYFLRTTTTTTKRNRGARPYQEGAQGAAGPAAAVTGRLAATAALWLQLSAFLHHASDDNIFLLPPLLLPSCVTPTGRAGCCGCLRGIAVWRLRANKSLLCSVRLLSAFPPCTEMRCHKM